MKTKKLDDPKSNSLGLIESVENSKKIGGSGSGASAM
jgi:hypothetical protein